MTHRPLIAAMACLLGLLAATQSACNKTLTLTHERAGGAEVGVLVVDEPKSIQLPGVRVEAGEGHKFVRVALHARGDGKLDESQVFLLGSSGTRASASAGWGDSQLESSFRVLEYWFRLPSSESPGSLELRGDKIAASPGKNVWPWRYEVTNLQVVDHLTVESKTGDRRLEPRAGEVMIVVEATFEPLLARTSPLAEADEKRGPLDIFDTSPAPDTSVQLRFLRLLGDGEERGIGAVGAPGSDAFFANEDMRSTAVASAGPKIACRLASRIEQADLAKIKQLAFGPLRVSIPRT